MCSTARSRSATSTAASTARTEASESSMPTTTSCPRPGRGGTGTSSGVPPSGPRTTTTGHCACAATADDEELGVPRGVDELGCSAPEPVLRLDLRGVERRPGTLRPLVDERLGGMLERRFQVGEVHGGERRNARQVDAVHQGQVLALLTSRLCGPPDGEL